MHAQCTEPSIRTHTLAAEFEITLCLPNDSNIQRQERFNVLFDYDVHLFFCYFTWHVQMKEQVCEITSL